jgi:hypothetical protein
MENLKNLCDKQNLNFELAISQTDNSDLAEGLYIKVESDEETIGRYKYVRKEFITQIISGDSHWLDRPIIPNLLEKGELDWTY